MWRENAASAELKAIMPVPVHQRKKKLGTLNIKQVWKLQQRFILAETILKNTFVGRKERVGLPVA